VHGSPELPELLGIPVVAGRSGLAGCDAHLLADVDVAPMGGGAFWAGSAHDQIWRRSWGAGRPGPDYQAGAEDPNASESGRGKVFAEHRPPEGPPRGPKRTASRNAMHGYAASGLRHLVYDHFRTGTSSYAR